MLNRCFFKEQRLFQDDVERECSRQRCDGRTYLSIKESSEKYMLKTKEKTFFESHCRSSMRHRLMQSISMSSTHADFMKPRRADFFKGLPSNCPSTFYATLILYALYATLAPFLRIEQPSKQISRDTRYDWFCVYLSPAVGWLAVEAPYCSLGYSSCRAGPFDNLLLKLK
jgi:hypothetical protein